MCVSGSSRDGLWMYMRICMYVLCTDRHRKWSWERYRCVKAKTGFRGARPARWRVGECTRSSIPRKLPLGPPLSPPLPPSSPSSSRFSANVKLPTFRFRPPSRKDSVIPFARVPRHHRHRFTKLYENTAMSGLQTDNF